MAQQYQDFLDGALARARVAGEAFTSLWADQGEHQDLIPDLVAELLHVARQEGLHPIEIARRAMIHYWVETVVLAGEVPEALACKYSSTCCRTLQSAASRREVASGP